MKKEKRTWSIEVDTADSIRRMAGQLFAGNESETAQHLLTLGLAEHRKQMLAIGASGVANEEDEHTRV